jgi:hypothetical protein
MREIVTEVRGIRTNTYHRNPADACEMLFIDNRSSQVYLSNGQSWKVIDKDEIPDCFKPVLTEEERTAIMSNVSKKLSMCLLVSSAAFAKLTPAKQTEVLATSSGLPLIFVDDFAALRNKKKLIERLLKGEDVNMELEFNEIELTDDEKKALEGIRPVLERLRGAIGTYEWQIEESEAADYLRSKSWRLNGQNTSIRSPTGYELGKPSCRKVWNEASKVWGNPEEAATQVEVRTVNGYDRAKLTVNKNGIQLGCQTVSRKEVEAVALYYGFEPNVDGETAKKKAA